MTSLLSAVLQLRQAKANPILHLNILNPHMDTMTFDHFICTEMSSTHLNQSHFHISSFGFGGTNGHAVLHGENAGLVKDTTRMFMRRLGLMSPPEVRPFGKDPNEWETDGLDRAADKDDLYTVTITKDDAVDKPVKYVLEQQSLGVDFDDNDTSYSIIGAVPFSEEPLVMEDGDVPGLHSIIVEVPDSGEILFNFVQTMEPAKVLAPETTRCSRKTRKIVGPAADLTNKWVIFGKRGTDVRIDLFTSRGIIALNWVPLEECSMGGLLAHADDMRGEGE